MVLFCKGGVIVAKKRCFKEKIVARRSNVSGLEREDNACNLRVQQHGVIVDCNQSRLSGMTRMETQCGGKRRQCKERHGSSDYNLSRSLPCRVTGG